MPRLLRANLATALAAIVLFSVTPPLTGAVRLKKQAQPETRTGIRIDRHQRTDGSPL